MKKLVILYTLISSCVAAFAQKAVVSGTVMDEKDKSAMIGVNVRLKGTSDGATTDFDGKYTLEVPASAPFTLELTYTGYQTRLISFAALAPEQRKTSDVLMTETSKDLDIVVVTGSKFEKKFGEQTVSMEVLKGQNITQSNQTMNEAVNKVPGVTMLGKTISIRGGSGFADATGNRVMFLLDDIPLVNPDNGGINWYGVPTEAINQMEIVKGASSAATGGSALNGVINVRTITPSIDKPFNKLYLNIGLYDHHKNRDFYWFLRKTDKNGKEHYIPPVFGGVSFVHSSRIKNVDLTFNVGYSGNQGYMQNQSANRVRTYLKLKYSPTKMPNLAVGIAGNVYVEKGDDFFRYQSYHNANTGDSMTLVTEYPNKISAYSFNVMPYVTYFDKYDNRHAIKTAVYHSIGYNTAGDSTTTTKVWAEYSFSKRFEEHDLNLAAGISGYYSKSPGKSFGARYEANTGAFVQVDKKFFKRLTISGGMRLEFNKLDTTSPMNEQWVLNKILNRDSAHLIKSPVQPLFRFGINFQAAEATFIRASFGQGYRYPSFSEKFIFTARTGIYVVPNFGLQPEHGWSAEIGVKQGVKISKWVFYADVAVFVNKYRNMINFISTNWGNSPVPKPDNTTITLVSKAVNTERALIYGVDVSTIGTGKIFGVPLNFLIGYTYMDPLDLNGVDAYNTAKDEAIKNNTAMPDPNMKYLSFRMKHSGKADIQVEPKSVIVGITGTLTSQMLNIGDFNKLTPIRKWRESHTSADFVLDARLGYNWKDKITATAIVKNILNHEYTQRPGYVEPPRNYTLLLTYSFGSFKKKKEQPQ